MANKYQLINEMASETLKEITQNGESWIKFLNTASNNYKYSFASSLNFGNAFTIVSYATQYAIRT